MNNAWQNRPLADLVTSRPGNNRIIKGKQSDQPYDGLVQGYSASGPDVWVTTADYKQPGVVISAVGARCGRTFMANGEWTAIANTHVLLPSKDIDPRWLWYRTNDEEFWIKGGAAQPFVKVKDTLQQPCRIPPVSEQQRIVSILDKTFDGIATAKANAERNLKNARALFKSHLQSVFTKRGKGWRETTVGRLVTDGILAAPIDGNHGEIHPKKADFVTSGVPFIMASDLENGVVNQQDCAFISRKQADSLRKGFAVDGDVLISHKGTIGRVAILRTAHDYVMLTPQVTYYRVTSEQKLLNRFLYYALQAPDFVRRMNAVASAGATRAYIGILKQQELPIAFPNISEQKRLANQLDILASETQRLKTIFQQKLDALDALKKSLVHRAFAGEL